MISESKINSQTCSEIEYRQESTLPQIIVDNEDYDYKLRILKSARF